MPPRPWILLCKPVRAPFRDGTSVLVRNMLQAMPADVPLAYFGDPAAPVRAAGDEVLPAGAMAYQPRLVDKARMLGRLATPRLSRLPIHSFFAANRASSQALEVLRRVPRRRAVMQTLPASTGAPAVARWLGRLDRVIVTSEWGRRSLVEAGLGEDRVARIYPGIDVPEALAGPPVDQRRTILFAGDLDPEVGERLIEVARALRGAPQWRLEIATRPKGEAHAQVRRHLEQTLGAAIEGGQVSLLGEVPQMTELFDRAALQLYLASHARRKVDLPLVLLEGLARGVPVAIVDAQPVGELLAVARDRQQEIGLALDPARFGDAAASLLEALDDPARLRAMAESSPEEWPAPHPLALTVRYRWRVRPPCVPAKAREDALVGRWRDLDERWRSRVGQLEEALEAIDDHRGRLVSTFARLEPAALGFGRTAEELRHEHAAVAACLPSQAGAEDAHGLLQRLAVLEDRAHQLHRMQEEAKHEAHLADERDRQRAAWEAQVAEARRERPRTQSALREVEGREASLHEQLTAVEHELGVSGLGKRARKDLDARRRKLGDELERQRRKIRELRSELATFEERIDEPFAFVELVSLGPATKQAGARFVPAVVKSVELEVPDEDLPEVGALRRLKGQRYLVLDAWEHLDRGEAEAERLGARLVAAEGS
ncbi:MAG: glycosyltransferase [Myxococcales bacterium]|nr:glycosyltransferase [Myxococcales bacterium]